MKTLDFFFSLFHVRLLKCMFVTELLNVNVWLYTDCFYLKLQKSLKRKNLFKVPICKTNCIKIFLLFFFIRPRKKFYISSCIVLKNFLLSKKLVRSFFLFPFHHFFFFFSYFSGLLDKKPSFSQLGVKFVTFYGLCVTPTVVIDTLSRWGRWRVFILFYFYFLQGEENSRKMRCNLDWMSVHIIKKFFAIWLIKMDSIVFIIFLSTTCLLRCIIWLTLIYFLPNGEY